jgi:hypothetical protein
VVDDRCRIVRYDRGLALLETPTGDFRVGEAGDWLLAGDWDCDGEATVALYRPGDGTVRLFGAWPGPDASEVTSAAPRSTGVIGGRPRTAHAGGCDRVVVDAGGGPGPAHPTP